MASPITADDFSTQVQIHSALSAPAPNASAPSPSPTAPSVAQTPKVVHISSVEVPPENLRARTMSAPKVKLYPMDWVSLEVTAEEEALCKSAKQKDARATYFKHADWTNTDTYGVLMTLPIALVGIGVWIACTVLALPLLPMENLAHRWAKSPAKYADEGWSRNRWLIFASLSWLVLLPRAFIGFIWWVIVFIYAHFAALPWFFLSGNFARGTLKRNLELVWPFLRLGAGVADAIFHPAAQVRLMAGMMNRAGFWTAVCEYGSGRYGGASSAIAYVPIMKWCLSCNILLHELEVVCLSCNILLHELEVVCLSCNILLHELEVVYVNQWTAAYDESVTVECLYHALKYMVSYGIHEKKALKYDHRTPFVPFYPYPPPRSPVETPVRGAQFCSNSKMLLFTESIHVPPEITARSSLCLVPIYEVNIEKDANRLEHPMWCIAAKTYSSFVMIFNVNQLFADFSPYCTAFVKRQSMAVLGTT
eukprot:g44848.t1